MALSQLPGTISHARAIKEETYSSFPLIISVEGINEERPEQACQHENHPTWEHADCVVCLTREHRESVEIRLAMGWLVSIGREGWCSQATTRSPWSGPWPRFFPSFGCNEFV